MAYTVTTPPAVEPITTTDQELQDHLKWTTGDGDADLINNIYVPTARRIVERYTQRALITQTITENFDKFPPLDWLRLSVMGVTSVTSIKYYDEDDTQQTWSSGEYVTDFVSRKARIAPGLDYEWPSVSGRINSVEIIYVAGAATAAAVSQDYKTAIMWLVGEMYEERTDRIHKIPTRVLDLINPESYWSF